MKTKADKFREQVYKIYGERIHGSYIYAGISDTDVRFEYKQPTERLEKLPDDMYNDQIGWQQECVRDRIIGHAYTPAGVHCIDSNFCALIKDRKVDPDLLEYVIRYNVHLHDIIKENLLDNLSRLSERN